MRDIGRRVIAEVDRATECAELGEQAQAIVVGIGPTGAKIRHKQGLLDFEHLVLELLGLLGETFEARLILGALGPAVELAAQIADLVDRCDRDIDLAVDLEQQFFLRFEIGLGRLHVLELPELQRLAVFLVADLEDHGVLVR